MEQDKGADAAATVRTLEIAVALGILVLSAVVIWDSLRLGMRWAEDGPQAGYFPFYIGLIMALASVVNLVRTLRNPTHAQTAFVTRGQFKLVLAVLVPLAVYAALVKPLGIYVASIVFIAWFMWKLGKYSWTMIVPVAFGTMIGFFLMFEVWFKVPLPKGPLEALIGFA
ncbi:MAG: tripartite tricarboxylate transporter TctB family protein [Burkholderiales bacterium]|nr:tripartite tricarboxylate transporter TctB family protein [Burkholderiales bacterium]